MLAMFMFGGLFLMLVVILAFVFWIGMLLDAIRNPRLDETQKIVWVMVVLFLHFVGALIYFFAGREPSAT
jgi:hypothetical protein